MVQNMITLLSVMIALLLVLIAINAVLRWLNPRNINGEEAAAFRAHRQNVFGFLALAVLFLGAYVGVSVLDNSVFFAVNSAVTPGLVYGSRLLVKLLATVAGIAILVIVLLLLLGMVVCGARSVWYAVFNKQDKGKGNKGGQPSTSDKGAAGAPCQGHSDTECICGLYCHSIILRGGADR